MTKNQKGKTQTDTYSYLLNEKHPYRGEKGGINKSQTYMGFNVSGSHENTFAQVCAHAHTQIYTRTLLYRLYSRHTDQ